MGYIRRTLIAIDQLGNALAGGNPDCTISGRIGYYSNHANGTIRWYWKILEYIVNETFFPLDGPCHCNCAFHNEEDEKYIAPKGFMVFILSLITIVSCIILALPFHLLWLFNIVKPKRNEKYSTQKSKVCQN